MKVAAIIPAYNEEENIALVLSVVTKIGEISEILVVDDGSIDKTAQIAQSFGVKVLQLPKNQGKSLAMREGMFHTDAPIIMFLDADLIGLTEEQVKNMLSPIIAGYGDMSLGIFSSGRSMTDLAQKVAPYLTGQRVVKRWILDGLDEDDWLSGFGIEIAITQFAKGSNIRIVEVPLNSTSHVMKEEKMGVIRGVAARARMYWDIMKQLSH